MLGGWVTTIANLPWIVFSRKASLGYSGAIVDNHSLDLVTHLAREGLLLLDGVLFKNNTLIENAQHKILKLESGEQVITFHGYDTAGAFQGNWGTRK